MPKIPIKISSVQNLTDARYFAAYDAGFMGFCIDENAPDYIGSPKIKEIASWIEGPVLVAQWGDESPVKAGEITRSLGIQSVEVAAEYAQKHLADLHDYNVWVNVKLAADTNTDSLQTLLYQSLPAASVVLDFSDLDLAFVENWNKLYFFQKLCSSMTVYLYANFSIHEIEKWVSLLNPEGIVLKGGIETQTGLKNYSATEDIMDWLEEF